MANLYAQRNPSLTWRSNWFKLSRSSDDQLLTTLRDQAFEKKLQLIDRYGRGSGLFAGYDPAGTGSPWYSVGPRNVNGRVKALAVHPTDPNTIYAGAASGGIWKSVDGGQTWDALWNMQESLAIGALAIARSSPNTIYVGTGEWTPGWGGSYSGAGVYVSTDAGATWSRRPAVKARNVGKLIVDPKNLQRLWVCGDHGLERSTDGGVTWTTLHTGTTTDIVLDPTDANTVYIAVRFDGFYSSTNGGNTFKLLPGSPTGAAVEWPQLAIGVSGPHANKFIVIKMGDTIQTSINGGTTFTVVPGSHGGFYPAWCDVIACAPDDEQILFWGGVSLDRTANGGNLWTSLPVHADQHAVVFAPSNSKIVYIANDGGVWRSDDKGATVKKVSNGLVITQFYNINFWRPLSNLLGGGTQDNGVNYTTGGLTWTQIYGGDGGWFIFDPVDPRVIYTESQFANVQQSTNGGETWSSKTCGITGTSPWEGVLTMDPKNNLRLFYGTDRVLRSTDGLATCWQESSQVLTGEVTAIAVGPSFDRVYAGTLAGKLYRSMDGGNTKPWADKSNGLPGRVITSIVTITYGDVDTGFRDSVMVSIGGLSGTPSSQSVYRSTDLGDTWIDVSGDLPQVVGNSIALDPSFEDTWYLATDTGVFRTTNTGKNWLPFDNGIPNVPCSSLVVDFTAKILYCGTFGRGAYKLDVTPHVIKNKVDVYVRDNNEDTGERRPSPSGLPDPSVPAPGVVEFWMSPDIKVNHNPVFTPTGVFDGVDFDTTLTHQDPFRGQRNRFFIQVHNRGWETTRNVSVRAFVAPATTGLPNLPNALVPPNFDLVPTTAWQPLGPAKTISELKPNRPFILFWDYHLPADAATHTCCLAVVSSPDDRYNNPSTDVAQIILMDKRVCLKNLHVVDPGPGPMSPTMTTVDFHNPKANDALIDIMIRPSGFIQGRIGLLLPKFRFSDPEESTDGVDVIQLSPNDPIGQWYSHGDKETQALLARRLAACDRTHLFEFDGSKPSQLRGIKLAPGETLSGVLVSTLGNDVSVTGPSRFDVIQSLDGKVAGGSQFQFGYELPVCGQFPRPRRVRITANSLIWDECAKDCDHSALLARVTVADDQDRTYDRILGHEHCMEEWLLFDGIITEGETLTLSLIEAEAQLTRFEVLYSRRFTGGFRSWLGKYHGEGKEGLKVDYEIEEVSATEAPGGD